MSADIGMEVVDGRDALGIVICVNGEWFEGSHRLLSHVSQTRRKYGEPMRAWEQVARHAAAKILDTGQIRIL